MELLTGFEPVTSSLPRKCSTPELQELETLNNPAALRFLTLPQGLTPKIAAVHHECPHINKGSNPGEPTAPVSSVGESNKNFFLVKK